MPSIELRGIRNYRERVKQIPRISRRAAKLSVNAAIRKARTLGSAEIRKQVNLTKPYVDERLVVSKFASDHNMEARLSARFRPTQLVRFSATQSTRKGKRKGVRVKVKRSGSSRVIRQAFFVRLRSGRSEDGNIGVAVRSTEGLNLKSGKRFGGKGGYHVLYGPSVYQVFDTVRDDIEPEVSGFLNTEFERQVERLSQ